MHPVNNAVEALRQGKMIIVTDDPARENEGDLVILSERIQAKDMNFIIRHTSGIVCVTIDQATATRLQLEPMVSPGHNTSLRETPFTVSVDAKDGISTGVSADDRTRAVKIMRDQKTGPDDLVKPGHLFPLVAKPRGVLQRQGHTEAAFDLAMLATNGESGQAVLSELMNEDGSMMRGETLHAFAKQHGLLIISIAELIHYRRSHENHLELMAKTPLPMEKYGEFECRVFREIDTDREHLVLSKPNTTKQAPLIRIHSSCMTGDIFHSLRCDCHEQLHHALERVSEEGGMVIYLNQEGRGIGLGNKIKTYELQNQGVDTVQANLNLGLPADAREYHVAANILRLDHCHHVRLLTNNPTKVQGLIDYGVAKVDREAMPVFATAHNHQYLSTKRDRLNHHIDLPHSKK
jgi:3,4-dihydroxy 2-butanone 4-phosphate synthase/GTP cyclohydrolase II